MASKPGPDSKTPAPRRRAEREGARGVHSETPKTDLISVRVSPELSAWLAREAEASNTAVAALIRDSVVWSQTLFHVPPVFRHHLDADRKALGLNFAAYMQHVLLQRALVVQANRPGFDLPADATPPPSPPPSKP